MRQRAWCLIVVGGVATLLPLLFSAGCPSTAGPFREILERPGNEGLAVADYGAERRVTLEAGNLSEESPTSEGDRVNALETFLTQYREFFGAGTAKAGLLALVATAPELSLGFGDASLHQVVSLQQEHQGALVLEGLVQGEFVGAVGTRETQLRRVQGTLFDPGMLPTPPEASEVNLATARRLLDEYLIEQDLLNGEPSVLQVPVISVANDRAGFLGVFTGTATFDFESQQDRILLLIDPSAEVIEVLTHLPGCAAGQPTGEAL